MSTSKLSFQDVAQFFKKGTYGTKLDPKEYPFVAAGYEPTPRDQAASDELGNCYKDGSAAKTLQYLAMLGNSSYCATRTNEHILRVMTTAMSNLILSTLDNKKMLRDLTSSVERLNLQAKNTKQEDEKKGLEDLERVSTSS